MLCVTRGLIDGIQITQAYRSADVRGVEFVPDREPVGEGKQATLNVLMKRGSSVASNAGFCVVLDGREYFGVMHAIVESRLAVSGTTQHLVYASWFNTGTRSWKPKHSRLRSVTWAGLGTANNRSLFRRLIFMYRPDFLAKQR